MGDNAVEEIAAAARTTLATGSARVHVRVFSDADLPAPLPAIGDLVSEGVTDLARRRTRVEKSMAGWQQIWEHVIARVPWLDDGEELPDSMTDVYAGTRRYVGDPRRGWFVGGEGDAGAQRRGIDDPTWILEVLEQVDGGHERAPGHVRGEPCRRFGFGIDLRRHHERIEVARGGLMTPHLAGDVWLDAAERIRRVTWTGFTVSRPRSPRRTNGARGAWTTVELWDFGVDVDIELPDIVNREGDDRWWPAALYGFAGELWRAKRAYDRREVREGRP